MSMGPERVAERVAGMIESIRCSESKCFGEHNAHESLYYLALVHELDMINDPQFAELERAIHDASRDWRPGSGVGASFTDGLG
ncbi:hypothetical protein [Pseudomonas syringae group genomosp. 3]|nr:hypothetical protein [Pseudomonas syringae group genomosp. 3]